MNDSILDEEINMMDDMAESISKSYDSRSKRKFNSNFNNSKKNRRSRIIISDASEIINENRKEIYDAETKIKKSIISAIRFNDSLNENRKETSNVFLKRKIKAAFEREPIDKTKGFFNVPFVPMPGMFSVIPSNQPMTGSLSSQHGNRPMNPSQHSNPNVPSKISNNPNVNPPPIHNLSKNDQTVVINMNKPKEEATLNPSSNQTVSINLKNNPVPVPVPVINQVPQERSNSIIQNQTSNSVIQSASQSRYLGVNNGISNNKYPNTNTKHLFNVNAGDHSKNPPSDSMLKAQPPVANISNNQQITTNSFNLNVSEDKEIKHQINDNSNYNKNTSKNTFTNSKANLNDVIPSNNSANNQDGKICISLGQILSPTGSLLNLSQEDIKKLKPEQIEQLNKIIRQKNQLQQQSMNQNNRLESSMNTANKTINAPTTQNTNNNNNFSELLRLQQNSIYMQAVECYKNDPEKFKSEKTTNELIKLQKLISMSKMQTDQNNFSNNNQSNQFMTSNFIPKEGINSSYQLNLQLLQSIQKQLQRRESNQIQNQINNNINNHPNNSTNSINLNISNNLNNSNISNISNPQISKTNQTMNTTKMDLNFNGQN